MKKNNVNFLDLLKISIKAGRAILDVYDSNFSVDYKDDDSPLTLADQKAHDVIVEGLQKLDSSIPILSEEGCEIDFTTRQKWDTFWCVDPLDGTKEFVKRNGEFTVNIALIQNNKSVLGVIYVPVTDILYFAESSLGSFKYTSAQNINAFSDFSDVMKSAVVLPFENSLKTFTVVGSRSHISAENETYNKTLQDQYGNLDIISVGSSLKFCLVAEGRAHCYPRFGPTMEWDTAAGQCIAECAGCSVTSVLDDKNFIYNKEVLRNSSFIVKRIDLKNIKERV